MHPAIRRAVRVYLQYVPCARLVQPQLCRLCKVTCRNVWWTEARRRNILTDEKSTRKWFWPRRHRVDTQETSTVVLIAYLMFTVYCDSRRCVEIQLFVSCQSRHIPLLHPRCVGSCDYRHHCVGSQRYQTLFQGIGGHPARYHRTLPNDRKHVQWWMFAWMMRDRHSGTKLGFYIRGSLPSHSVP